MGNILAETSPASTKIIAITLAKIGRSMKNLDMNGSPIRCSTG
jgi:hypothetical protein